MIKISNHDIRLLWLKSHRLLNTNINTKKLDVLQIIKDLGFVQIDSIQNVTRAQNHILWSRNNNYKEHMLDDLLLSKGKIFEHFTHDASVIPVDFYPMYKGHFKRTKERLDKSKYYKELLPEDGVQDIRNRLESEGALNIKDFQEQSFGEKKTWSRSITKTTLDYMWHCGELSTAYRQSFRKYYDLSESIIPLDILSQNISHENQVDWLCTKALDCMSVASAKEIKNFWASLSIQEVNAWIKNNQENLCEVQWLDYENKEVKSYAPINIQERLSDLKNSNLRIQIINPFDPAIRDRIRLKKIFGFDYKIEIFVPKEKRIWGYYIYPILQGNKFIGRIELQANRKENVLSVINFWKEEGALWNDKQQEKLDSELSDFALLVGISKVTWIN